MYNNLKKFKEKAINKYSGKDCWFSTANRTLSYDSDECDFFVYYLNGEVKQRMNGGTQYDYFENGGIQLSAESQGNFFVEKHYYRNGMLNYHNKFNTENYDNIKGKIQDFYDEYGIQNKDRLFKREKELYF